MTPRPTESESDAVTITVAIPGMLRHQSGGAREFSLRADTVRSALAELERVHPELHRSVCDETGAIRRHVNLFVNRFNIRDHQGIEMRLRPGDVLTILPAVSGG